MESVGRHPARENPSFSSSLLDEMYRSIDIDQQQLYTYGYQYHQQEKVVVRRRADFKNTWQQRTRDYLNTSSSSSDSISISSCGGGGAFSSSEAELSRPIKPIQFQFQFQYNNTREKQLQGRFVKTKSRAMKIYGDLKQPISPGGRLATFINSLFTNLPSSSSSMTRKSKSKSTSFSQTPSSKGNLSNNKITSVRDCQPYAQESNLHSPKMHSTQQAARNLLKKKVECEFDLIRNTAKSQDDDDDDDGSHTSSDLFELENFSTIGSMDKYRDELPVYETTHLDW